MLKKIKKFMYRFKKNFYSFAMTNRQFITFVSLLVVETSLLVLLTLGIKGWGFKTLFFDFAMAVLLGSIGYLFKPKNQYYYFQTVLCFITIICLINAIYFTFYDSFVTVGLIESLGQARSVKEAVFDKLLPIHFIYIIFPLIFGYIHRSLMNHNYFNYIEKIEDCHKNFKTTLLVGFILLCLNALTITPTDISRLVKQWNREYIVERYGIIIYQFNDIIQSAHSRLFSYFGYDNAAMKFVTYYNERDNTHKANEYTDIYNGKNVVFIHMESIMSMFVDLKIDGKEVTPNLNKLTQEGLYFSNFYPQISVGTSSDTEFTLSTSLMPALSGTVFVNYFDRDYVTLQELLKDKGYYTFSMHANSSSMWNRAKMYNTLGYDNFYAKEYFDVTEENTIGLGLSDHEFFKQAIPYLKKIETENSNYMGTIITLTNHTPWDGGDAYGKFDVSLKTTRIDNTTGKKVLVEDPYLEGTRLGNYIRSAHYADECLGEFIDYLYKNDLFDNTVLVFYGDHDAKLTNKEYSYLYNYDIETGKLRAPEDEDYFDYDYYVNELNKKTPLIIWTKDHKYSGEVDYYMGMIDVLPTLGNMMGFSSKYALGHDIFDIKSNNIIVFPNGNFLTENLYYNNSKSEYKVLKEGLVIDEDYIKNSKKYVDEVLEISNSIIVYNLISLEGDKVNE